MVKYDDLEEALDFVSSAGVGENQAFLCRSTGVIYWQGAYIEDQPLPDDIDSDDYISIPHKLELDLGKQLALRFTEEVLPDRISDVRSIFGRRGAYARFKDLLGYSGHLQQWYDYEAKAVRQALLAWCADNGIEVSD